MKGVHNYLKNVTKSTIFMASDIVKKDLAPNVGEFTDTNAEFFRTTYQAIRNPRASVKKIINQAANSKMYQALDYGVRNAFEDLRTGNFYNTERKEAGLKYAGLNADDFGDLSEFGIDEDFNMSDDEEVSAGDRKIVTAIEQTSQASANTTANAVITAANASIQSQRISNGILYQQNEKLHGRLHSDVTAIGSTMNTILELQKATFENLDKNTADYFSKSLKLQTENNAILKEMLEMQREQYKTARQKEEEEKAKRTKRGARYSDVSAGEGVPDLAAYFENVKKNIKNKTKEFIPIAEISEDGNMLMTMMSSPWEYLLEPMVKSMIPKVAEDAAKELDKSISGVFGTLMARLANANDGPLNILAGLLGVRTGVNKNIDTSRYAKGAVPFDGITRKSIVEVIPTYLRRIESALTGRPEQVYDLETGKWTTLKAIKDEFNNIHKNSVRRGTSDVRDMMNSRIRANRKSFQSQRDRDNFDKAVEEFFEYLYENNGQFNPAYNREKNNIDYKYTNLNKDQYYRLIVDAYTNSDIDKTRFGGRKAMHTNLSTRLGSGGAILSAKDAEEAMYRHIEDSVDSKFISLFANGGKIDENGKYVEGKSNNFRANKSGLMLMVDDKNNNIFDYLQNINKELQWQREYITANGTGGGSGDSTPSWSSSSTGRIIPDFSTMTIGSAHTRPNSSNVINDNEKNKRELIAAILAGEMVNPLDYSSDNEKDMEKFYDDLAYISQRMSAEDKRKARNAAADENFITRLVNRTYVSEDKRNSKYSSDDFEELESMVLGTVRNNTENEDDKNDIFSGVKNRIGKTKKFFTELIQSPGELFADVAYTADRLIYDMMFKNAIKAEGDDSDVNKYDGFVSFLVGKTKDTFEGLKTKLLEDFINPLKEKLGIGDDFKDRTKDSLKNLGTNIMGKIIQANKEVYKPAADYLNEQFDIKGTINKATAKFENWGATDESRARKIRASIATNKGLRRQANALSNGTFDPMTNPEKAIAILTGEAEWVGPDGNSVKGVFTTPDNIEKIKKSCTDANGNLNKGKFTEALDKIFLRNWSRNNAKGTLASIPFTGNTMLSKGELLMNRTGVSVVGKTGAYSVNEPTHIMSSYDSYPLLKSLGIDFGKRKTPQQDLAEENRVKSSMLRSISNNASGTVQVNGPGSIDMGLVKENIKKYAPEGVAGGIVGGIVSTLFGIVGGPLVGASIGAAGNIIASSDTLKDKLFGQIADDGKRHGGVISSEIMNTINKYVPDALKWGAAGIIPGLITPLGPLGGILVGGAIGVLKNNEMFTNKYFGENGKLTFDDKTKKVVQDLMPGAAKGAAVGAVATLFGGPFGLLGNAALGAGVGMIASTQEFKDMILGQEINGVRSGGVVGAFKDMLQPLKDAGKNIASKLVEAFDEGIVSPIAEFITPAIHEIPHLITAAPRFISDILSDKLFSDDNIVGRAILRVTNPLIKGFESVTTGALGVIKKHNPFQLLGKAGEAIRKRQIKDKRADYMTAAERIEWLNTNNRGTASEFDQNLAAIGTEGGMTVDKAQELMNKMAALRDSSAQLSSDTNKQQKNVLKMISDFSAGDESSISAKDQAEIKKAIKSGNYDKVVRLLKKAKTTTGKRLSADDIDILMGDDKEGLTASLAKLNSLEARKKYLGTYGGKNKSATFEALKNDEDLRKLLGKDALDGIHNYRDFDKYIANINTELIDRKVNGDNAILKTPEEEELEKQTNALIHIDNMISALLDTANAEGKEASEKAIDKIKKGMIKYRERDDRDYATRMANLIDALGTEGFNKLPEGVREILCRGEDEELYKSIIGPTRAAKESADKMVSDFIPDTIHDMSNTVSNIGEDISTIKDNAGFDLRQAGKNAKGSYGRAKIAAKKKLDTAVNGLHNLFNKQTLTTGAISGNAIVNNPEILKLKFGKYQPEGEAVVKLNDIGLSSAKKVHALVRKVQFANVITPAPLTADEITLLDNNGDKILGKCSVIYDYSIKIAGTAGKDASKDFLSSYDTIDKVNSATVTSITADANKYLGTIANNGIGTFLLNAGRSAVNGIKNLFGGNKDSEGKSNVGAMAALSSLLNSKANKSESDSEVMGGDNMVREDGNTMKMKRDANGSMVPDTADSNTKKTLNIIALKEKAQEKAQQAQVKASEILSKIFEPDEGKKKGIGWLGIAIGAAALAKSGLLKKFYDNFLYPIWDKKLKPWFHDKAIPWLQDTAVPWVTDKVGTALETAANTIIDNLPNVFSTALGGITELLDFIATKLGFRRKKTDTKTSVEKLDGNAVFYDENGNKINKNDLQPGVKYYNKDGAVVTIDEDGNVTVKAKKEHAYIKQAIPNFIRSGVYTTAGLNVGAKAAGLAEKGFSKLTRSKSLIGKAVGYTGKAFTKPITLADDLAEYAVQRGGVKQIATNLSDNVAKKAGNIGSKASAIVGKIGETKAGTAIAKAGKAAGGGASKVITSITSVVNHLFENSTVLKAAAGLAKKLGIQDAAKWVTELAPRIIESLKGFAEGASKYLGKIGSKVSAKALALVFAITDFVTGMDQAEAILGVQDTDLLEEFVAGLTNAICNFTIVLSIFPGTGKVAEAIFKLFGKDLTERKAAAEEEYEEWKEKTGSELSLEQYLKQEKSVTGKLMGKVKGGIDKIKGKAKGGIKNITDNAKNIGDKIKDKTKSVVDTVTSPDTWINLFDKAKQTANSIIKSGTEPVRMLEEGDFKDYFTFKDENDTDNPFSGIKTAATAVSRILGFPVNMTLAIGNRVSRVISKRLGGTGNIIQDAFNEINESRNLIADGNIGEYFNFSSAYNKDKPLSAFAVVLKAISRITMAPVNFVAGGIQAIAKNLDVITDEAKYLGQTVVGEFSGNNIKLIDEGNFGEYFNLSEVGGDSPLAPLHKVVVGINRTLTFIPNLAIAGVHHIAEGFKSVLDGAKTLFGDGLFESMTTDAANTLAEGNLAGYFNIEDPAEDNPLSPVRKILIGTGRFLLFPYNAMSSLFKNAGREVTDLLGKVSESYGVYNDTASKVFEYLGKSKDELTGMDDLKVDTGSFVDPFFNGLLNIPKLIVKFINPFVSIGNKIKDIFSGDVFGKIKNAWNNFWSSAEGEDDTTTTDTANAGYGKYGPRYGMAKQIDPSIANIRYNAPGDTTYQTIGDSACGPAAAVTAIQSVYGKGNPTVDAARYAISRGYKEHNGGTRPEFFNDYFNKNGLGSSTYRTRSDIETSILNGNPTVLMGKDTQGVNSSNPYGKNPHYVTATGVDGRGNVIIQDPESKYDNQIYRMNDVLSKTSFGISAYGRSKYHTLAPRYGMAKYGSDSIEYKVWNTMRAKGYSEIATAGAMGNIYAESSFNPKAIEAGNGIGFGLIQWSYGRRKAIENYAKKHNKNVNDPVFQTEYLCKELDPKDLKQWIDGGGPHYGLRKYYLKKDFINTNSLDDAVTSFMVCFERPANLSSLDKRKTAAQGYYKAFTGKSIDTSLTSSDGSVSSSSSDTGSTQSQSTGFINAISDMISNSTIGKAYNLFMGTMSNSSTSNASSDSSSDGADSSITGADAARVVKVASKEVGYLEKASNSNLDDPKANPGSNNYTKYNKWYGMDGQPWCAMFSSWAADKAGISKKVVPKDAYTVTQYEKILNNGGKKVKPEKAMPADYIYFTKTGSSGGIYHVGIVEANDNGKIRTIEGNSGQKVARNTYTKSDYHKLLIARPNYSDKTQTTINVDSSKFSDTKTTQALGGNRFKPLSKYGTGYKYETRPEKIRLSSDNDRYGQTIEVFDPKNIRYGTGNKPESVNVPAKNNNTKLIETIIEILMSIADNTDKLNNIVTILNEKFGIDVSNELNNKEVNKNTKKSKLRSSLTQANSDIDVESINFILNNMNALASE